MTPRFESPFAIKNVASGARWLGAVALFALLSGCASGPGANRADPLEPMNRQVFRFNEAVDRSVLRPVATAYRDHVPTPVRTGVSNFFGNLGDVLNLANNVLQLKLQGSAETFMRLNVNTFFGLGGMLDVASAAGIERYPEDFGQTLGRWGVPSGAYVVLPLLGPSSVRDGLGTAVDYYFDPLSSVHDIPWRTSLYGLRVVDTRTQLLRASQLLDEAALDKYSFMRDAYLQRRRSEIRNGGDGRLPDDDE